MILRAHPFVLGAVLGGLLTGLVAGLLFDGLAVLVFSGALAVNALLSAAFCRWRPGLDAAAWKLWLAATLANPLLLAALAWSVDQWDCLSGARRGWDCLAAALGPLVALASLPAPLFGLIARTWVRPRSPG